MSDLTAGAGRVHEVQSAYLAMVRRKRLYGGVMLIVFVALMVSGFRVADARNAGGFWNGIGNIFAFPREVLSEAGEKFANLPGLMVKFLPSLIETINIAAASTLLGSIMAVVLSLLSTRGLAKWPRLVVLFRGVMDILRAFPGGQREREPQAGRGVAIGWRGLGAADVAGRAATGRAELSQLCAAALRDQYPRLGDPRFRGVGRDRI
jgi:ABC-type amino acid transport system permease subunit